MRLFHPKKKPSFWRLMMKIMIFFVLAIPGALLAWYYILPRYLEKSIEVNWHAQGNQKLEMTGYTVSVWPPFPIWWPYTMVINGEIHNTGDTTLELLEVNSAVVDCDGKSIAASTHDASMVEGSYSAYYEDLPVTIGQIIPPGQKRPIRLWAGGLITEDGVAINTSVTSDGTKKDTLTLKYFWNVFGIPVLKWCKADVTFVVREAKQNVVDWYQYWEEIPVVEVQQSSNILPIPIPVWRVTTKLDYDAIPIFNKLVEQYGNKGMPDPADPTSGKIITLPDGKQVVVGDFRPTLRFILTYYDEDGKFLGFQTSVPFDKEQYERWLARDGGYFVIGVDGFEFPYGAKIGTVKAYLELTPDD